MTEDGISRRGFLGKTVTAGAAALAGCSAPNSEADTDEAPEDTEEMLEPSGEKREEEIEETVEDAIEDYSEHVSENYEGVVGEELVSLTSTGSNSRQTLKVNVDLEEVFESGSIGMDTLNAYEVLKSGDMNHFGEDVGSTVHEDFIQPLLNIAGEYAGAEENNEEGYGFISLNMHSADDTIFGLTVNADSLLELEEQLEQADDEGAIMEDFVSHHTASISPSEVVESKIFVPEGVTKTVDIDGEESDIYVDDVIRDEDGRGWAHVDINDKREEDSGYIRTAEGTNYLVECSWLEKDEVSLNPEPYTNGVWFEITKDSSSEYHGGCVCDPEVEKIENGQTETYQVGGQEITAELVAVDEGDEALMRIDGELASVEEGKRYNIGDISYEAEDIFNMEDDEGLVKLAFKQDECYE